MKVLSALKIKVLRCTRSIEGSTSILALLLAVALMLFVFFPLFAVVLEKYMLMKIANVTYESTELALYSSITALNISESSAENYDFDSDAFKDIFDDVLTDNLKLNDDYSPISTSFIDDTVELKELSYYGTDDLPYVEPNTLEVYTRPFFHVEFLMPIKPHLYREILLDISGKEWYGYTIEFDVSMPVNN